MSGVQPEFWATSVALLTRPMRWRARPLEQTGPISAQSMRGPGGPFPWVSAQTERGQDWHSLDRHEDIRVDLEVAAPIAWRGRDRRAAATRA